MTRTAPAPLATGCSPAVQGPYGSQRHLAPLGRGLSVTQEASSWLAKFSCGAGPISASHATPRHRTRRPTSQVQRAPVAEIAGPELNDLYAPPACPATALNRTDSAFGASASGPV